MNSHDSTGTTQSPLPTFRLVAPSGSTAGLYLQGAHLASWVPAGGSEVLFMSRETRLQPGTPIRGGIPVIFPQFNVRGPLPQHGFARTMPWRVEQSGTTQAGAAFVHLALTDTEETRAMWPHAFLAEFLIEVGAGLTTALRVRNTGDSPFSFATALHTYFRVGDVRQVQVEGLEGSSFLGVEPDGEPQPVTAPIRVVGETNGVYTDTGDRLMLRDPSLDRTIVIDKHDFADAVVWNPWIERARDMPDFGDDEYLTMLCVESGNIAKPTRLAPGEQWTGTQSITVTTL